MRSPTDASAAGQILALDRLHSHVAACHSLDQDASAVLDELAVADKTETLYAVDFSEIYSLIFPVDTAAEMRVFDEEDDGTEQLVQLDALQYLFFRAPHLPLLLAPYGVEFQSLITRLRAGLIEGVLRSAENARREIEQILAAPEVDALLKTVDSDMTEEDVAAACALFESRAASLLRLTQDSDTKPLRRIEDLLGRRRLAELTSVCSASVTPTVSVRDRWFDRLVKVRGGDKAGASYIDAVAIATIHAANEQLLPSRRLVLVSRSSAMQTIFHDEFARDMWKDHGGYVLRHPRTFGSLYRRGNDDLLSELRQRQKSLRLFIDAAQTKLRSQEALRTDEAKLFMEQMTEIRRSWQTTETLSSTDLIGESSVSVPDATKKRQLVTIALKILRSRAEFEKIVNDRISELLVGIERRHEALGFALRTDAETDLGSDKVVSENFAGKTVLSSSRSWLPYTIQFVSEELNEWMRSLQATPDVDWRDIMTFLQSGLRSEGDYERLLAMAYLLANLNQWDAAEQFCERAVDQPAAVSVPRHEGHYFLAVCKRMGGDSLSRYADGIQHLSIAENTKKLFRGDITYDDPRYIAERATQICYWNREWQKLGQEKQRGLPRPPRLDEARWLWEKALTTVRDDVPLQLQLHNNLCYFYSELASNFDHQKIAFHLNSILSLHAKLDLRRKLNPLIVDTVAAARLRLHQSRPNVTALIDSRDRLRSELAEAQLLPKQRASLQETLRRVEAALH